MPLEEYKKKRKFNKTPEPTAGTGDENSLRFVVQKHAASHLHYDFRLELKGVLKSWAIPKGPSLNPDDTRLAMQTEDHPYDYLHFEGIIPKGQYGGGTVIVWDEGTYATPEIKEKDKKAQEHSIMSQFFKGGILLNLNGQKLKGKFALIKDPNKDKEDRSWYLMKIKDKNASKKDVANKDKSVLSGLSVEQMAENPKAKQWQSNRREKQTKTKPIIEIKATAEKASEDFFDMVSKGIKAEMPALVKPMLCDRIYEPFDGADWLFELKLDGYRIVAGVTKDKVVLRTRELQDYTDKYQVVVNDLHQLGHEVLLDGEVVAHDEKDRPNFSLLQNYKSDVPLKYCVFDILWADGYDLTQLPLINRKEILKAVIPELEAIRYQDHILERGVDFFELVKENALEGIVAKKMDSLYYPDVRSKSWLKLPVEEFVEYVIVGYTESEHGRPFSRIMFGEYRDGKLYYVYHTGGGISDKLLYSTYKELKKIEIDRKPIANDAQEETPIHWVEPVLVGRFKEKKLAKTKSGKIRHPVIFLGIREDIEAKQVVGNSEHKEVEIVPQENELQALKPARKKKVTFDETEAWKQIHRGEEITETNTLEVEGKQITLINYQKEYWQGGITKLHVIMYYRTIADYILPYLKDRPMGLNVVIDWAGGETKFIRNMKGFYPDWVKVYSTQRRVEVKDKSEDVHWVICNDLATLLYLVNLGAVDFHPWAARTTTAEFPDYIIIDLDPDKTVDAYMPELVETGQAAKNVLDKYKLVSFVKTSGKRGMHILIPCEGIPYAQVKPIAEILAKEINKPVSKISTLERSTGHRGGRIYIDAYQNDYSDRLACVYSLRAYKQATVSTPIEWSEVNGKLDAKKFKIDNMQERLEEKGDLFKDLLDGNITSQNSKLLKKLL